MFYLFVLLIVITGIFFVIAHYGLYNLSIRQPLERRGRILWQDLGPTPFAEKKYAPQGMTWANGFIIFADTWHNKKSRVYKIDPTTMSILDYFDMPTEARHTSGLAWNGQYLWAVDYISNRCYKIDSEASFKSKSPKVIGNFDTTLKGTSACCVLQFKGETLLAISDFRRTRRTYFVRHENALRDQSAKNHIVFSYANENFSQGLVYDGTFLYEAENKAGEKRYQ